MTSLPVLVLVSLDTKVLGTGCPAWYRSNPTYKSLNMQIDGEVVGNDHAQHLHAATAHDAWQWGRLSCMSLPPPAVCKMTSHDLSQFNFRLFRLTQFCMLTIRYDMIQLFLRALKSKQVPSLVYCTAP